MNRFFLVMMFFCLEANANNPYASESAVYKIEIEDGNQLHIGTGVLVSPSKILTNCHVVNHKGNFRVIHRHTKEIFYPTSYYNLGSFDACVLRGNFSKGKPVIFAKKFSIGETVWHFGYPRGVSGSGQGPIYGMISVDTGDVIETGSFCNPGSSGGPLINTRGELVGLNFGVLTKGTRNKCLAIPALQLAPYINSR